MMMWPALVDLLRLVGQRGARPGDHRKWLPGSGGMMLGLAAAPEGAAGEAGPAHSAATAPAAFRMHPVQPLLAAMTSGDLSGVRQLLQRAQPQHAIQLARQRPPSWHPGCVSQDLRALMTSGHALLEP